MSEILRNEWDIEKPVKYIFCTQRSPLCKKNHVKTSLYGKNWIKVSSIMKNNEHN